MHLLQNEDFREIRESVFPLFNYTLTSTSEGVLRQIFTQVPVQMEEVIFRQNIIKGFLQNWKILQEYNYQVINFQEGYHFCSDLAGVQIWRSLSPLKRFSLLFFRKKTVLRNKSKLVQLLLLFQHLHNRFLGRMDLRAFPTDFQKQLLPFLHVYQNLQTNRLAGLISEDKFSAQEVLILEQRLLLVRETGELAQAWEALFIFEAYFSLTKGIVKHGFVFPVFQTAGLDIQDFFHPLLVEPVKNSLRLRPQENVVLVTGPNMSGKSVLFKSLSLCVYLGHLGLAVPAASCALPYFSRLSVSINSRDDVASGYSHFMQELMTLKEVVERALAEEPVFAVFDELFKGTNIDDAQQILLDTISGLRRFKNSFFFISTHLLHLQEQEAVQDPEVKKYHIDCLLVNGTPTFTYRLKEGWSEVKIGKVLFEQVGLQDLLSGKLNSFPGSVKNT